LKGMPSPGPAKYTEGKRDPRGANNNRKKSNEGPDLKWGEKWVIPKGRPACRSEMMSWGPTSKTNLFSKPLYS